MSQSLLFTNDVAPALGNLIRDAVPATLHIIADENTARLVVPRLGLPASADLITIPSGDDAKTLDTLASIWTHLVENGATRSSLTVNVGGGMVTDIGGMAAATFKRGMRFVNLPTTLLGAVDAAVGGKTGINFHGLKNEIGVFAPADAVIVSTCFFDTLPHHELLSGYAEMIKHALLTDELEYRRLIGSDVSHTDAAEMLSMLRDSVMVKKRIVNEDPHEKGLRRALNLGHTVGHALESFSHECHSPLPHGYAVAYGLLAEMIISHIELGFPSSALHEMAAFLKENYTASSLGMPVQPFPAITCDNYDRLIELMSHDKKNATSRDINFTLLETPGRPLIDRTASRETITAALDIMRDMTV